MDKLKTGSGKRLRTEALTETELPIPYDAASMPGASVLGTDGQVYRSVKVETVYQWSKGVTETNAAIATIDSFGSVKLADAASLRDSSSLTGSNDAQLDDSIEAEPNLVTVKALNYWKQQNRFVSSSAGIQYIYVDPENGRDITNLLELLSDPPVITNSELDTSTARQAVAIRSLQAAADYANAVYSPSTTVEFRCGKGVYWYDNYKVTFNTVATIRAWDYSANSYLNDNRDGGTAPFTGPTHYDLNRPTFLTKPAAGPTADTMVTYSQPLTLIFKETGTIIGCSWWGIQDTITSSTVPDAYFYQSGIHTPANSNDPNNWRALAKADYDNALNYFVREHAMKSLTPGKLYGHRSTSCLEFHKQGLVANVSISAITPASITLVGGLYTALICGSSELLSVSGLRLIGNCNLSSDVNTGVYDVISYRGILGDYDVDTYQFTGFATYLFGATPEIFSQGLSLILGNSGPQDGWDDQDGTANYNHQWNNITLLLLDQALQNNYLALPNAAGSGWKTNPPAFASVIRDLEALVTGGGRNWSQFRAGSNSYSGFMGVFGNYIEETVQAQTLGSQRIRYMNQFGYVAGQGVHDTIFCTAGGGITPSLDYSGLGPGEVGVYTLFTPLNVMVRAYRRGVDVTNAYTHIIDFAL